MRWFALIATGLIYWTFLEYVLHRFAFHRAGRFAGKRHLAHHANLMKRRLAIAPWQSMLGGAIVHGAVFVAVFGLATGTALLGGMMAGYAAYEWVHYGAHYRVPRTPIGRYLRSYHMAHHSRSPKARFGVTSPFWDVVFGTYSPVQTATPGAGVQA
jgi:sterol desaturase/sphingolipid hydroxylase (fatty acid hydroxylase superfamily)